MRHFPFSAALAMALAAGLSACGSPPQDEASPEAATTAATIPETPDAEAAATVAAGERPAAFTQCATCHSVEPGKNGVGPSLAGVFGRGAGLAPGYAYSEANKTSGLTWDGATLDEYLTAPMKKVPGTKMTFPGLPDPAKRKDVIAYLKTLK